MTKAESILNDIMHIDRTLYLKCVTCRVDIAPTTLPTTSPTSLAISCFRPATIARRKSVGRRLSIFGTSCDPQRMAEELRQRIAEVVVLVEGAALKLTASLGVATSTAHLTTAAIQRCADQAMYRAKHQGRNRVCCLDAMEPS
ncbi:MAG: diguanylate cyclase [Chromatiales bacterium]|nr:diguanylate cyclase [Chromatiales bacterium]